jgi:quercetin dioxygenase-like cupin family protein
MSSRNKVAITDARRLPAEGFGWGALKWLCNGTIAPGAQQTFGLVHILPGQRNPLHYHPNCEELLYVVSGEGEHRCDDEWVHLHPGMLIRIPAGVRHNLVNSGWEPISCILSFSSPDRQTVFLEEDHETHEKGR